MPALRTRTAEGHGQAANLHLEAKGPASAATDPDHGSNNHLEVNAVNDSTNTIAPGGAATIDFHKAFEGLEDDIMVMERRVSSVDYLIGMVLEGQPNEHGARLVSSAEIETLASNISDTFEVCNHLIGKWRETHNAFCDQQFKDALAVSKAREAGR